MQLDQAERGFSFRLDGPLDMRMGHDGPTAADVVAKASEADLANIIYIFGEERHSRGRRPRHRRRAQGSADHDHAGAGRYRRQGGALASRTKFIRRRGRSRRLRIFVNEELDELHLALSAAERVLKPGGRLVVVSFHSLEDRIVKNFLDRARQGRRRIAASAGDRAGRAELPDPDQAPGHAGRGGDSGQSARAFGKAARRRAHRCAGACRRRTAGMAVARRRDEGRLTMRIIHLLVIGVLVFAAAYVYRIKMESTVAHRARAAAARGNPRAARRHRARCAPNGPSSMRRCGCRAWPSGICR